MPVGRPVGRSAVAVGKRRWLDIPVIILPPFLNGHGMFYKER
jgi:hypothetical protein